jgi:hypothetical protein
LLTDLIYRCQEKAWFDQAVMMEWVEKILAPYVENVPRGIVPILFLNDFSLHKTGAVVRAIQALGVEVKFIPPGCTGMVQPVDVGYNKPSSRNFANSITNECWIKIQTNPFPAHHLSSLQSGSLQPSA